MPENIFGICESSKIAVPRTFSVFFVNFTNTPRMISDQLTSLFFSEGSELVRDHSRDISILMSVPHVLENSENTLDKF